MRWLRHCQKVDVIAPNLSFWKHALARNEASNVQINLQIILQKATQQIKNDKQVASNLTHAMLLGPEETWALYFSSLFPRGLVVALALITLGLCVGVARYV